VSCSADDLINVARAQLGATERPPGSNRTRYGAWYEADGQPWCAMFVSWCADQVGGLDIVPKHAYKPTGAKWFRDRGQWGRSPRVGAIAHFQWPSMGHIAHVGIVEAVRPDGAVVTVEGNTDSARGRTGGRVMRQVRRANIAGYGYPAYGGRSHDPGQSQGGQAQRVEVDGDFGPQTKKALQRALGVTVDGDVGPQTIMALQVRVGADPDGELGPRRSWPCSAASVPTRTVTGAQRPRGRCRTPSTPARCSC